MDVDHRDKDLGRMEADLAFNGGRSREIAQVFRRRMAFIRAAKDERDFYAMKSLHFEKLKGDRAHQRSIRLKDQWRLILEIIDDPKTIVVCGIEDYH